MLRWANINAAVKNISKDMKALKCNNNTDEIILPNFIANYETDIR